MILQDLWYKNAVVYCLDVQTFLDSDGDGIGDFRGLGSRLDYLAGLGVTCIWLLPFQPSPRRDDGYDVSDYYGVDPRFGTLGDFVEFTNLAQNRGIRVIVDLVINHTSNEHRWFQEARSHKSSRYRDWYVWSKSKPKGVAQGVVFPGIQKSTWTYDAKAREWYFHRFFEFQPDLNTENPEVAAEIRRIIGFWLELGVSGFRVDAVPFVIAAKGANRQPHQRFDFLRDMRLFLQWRSRDAILLAEANVLANQDLEYFGHEDDRMHMMFNFLANQHLFYALAAADARPLANALEATKLHPQTAQWGHFLRNNDELDLGRLTDQQRRRVFAAFGPEENMQLYGRGIRRRFAPMMNDDRRRIELAYSLIFSLPGTPVIRYGDEIGMGDDLRLPQRDCGRTPMQWNARPNGGFSTANTTVLPAIDDELYGYKRRNMTEQRRDPHSLLNWMERMIRMAKECPETGWGEWQLLDTGLDSVLAIRYDWEGRTVVTVHNFADQPLSAHLAIDGSLLNLLSHDHSDSPDGRHSIALEAYGYRWYRAGGL